MSADLKSKQWPQVLAAVTCAINAFGMGLQFGWPPQAIPKILSDEFPSHVTSDETSYILLIGPLSYIVAAPVFASLADIIGRKKCLLLLAIPQLIAWILIANAKTVMVLYIARLIGSAFEGGLYAVYPMYLGEICEPKVRGVLGSSLSVSILLGQVVMTAYGSYTSITVSAYIACISPILFLLTFSWMPESPYFFLMKNRVKEAEQSLKALRKMDNVEKELNQLEGDVKRQMSESNSIKDLFMIDSNRRGLVVMFCLRTFQQLSGITPIGFYAQIIFKEGGDFLSPEICSIIYFLIQVTVASLAAAVVDKFGRRPLFMTSSFTTAIILFLLGVYYYLSNLGYDLTSYNWMPLVGMILYVICMSFGILVAPNLMVGEMFSTRAKAKALSICSIHFAILISILTQVFHLLQKNFGISSPFFLFGTCTMFGVVYGHFWMPETKGKTLEEIQQYLKGRRDTRKSNAYNGFENKGNNICEK
ncbi:facilitated trehalose transporter Tret1-like [Agrilus planipennis]|uniref:Facilitated trehalose transporter Tret1-like n=1 Tax=Agrilus planipennis TaxID=224129 RepID=A0A7F5RBV2_AGRPL|nr:facilitated trehalose transporter Tret1-like [Agrilus planipennis]XP_025833454.1 facilitated trehalose transporter Tret1-like [Agrilus planipennis]XP_025833455.1 facilitated trehalose transporter Tret1-like [Agrilus planipennis]XP_025833456.1 facilitated trehalose transporter Tret1-like [Agrilus planipennis]XP_025833457.1 facilitated trehalose transporter Tret1-like [Agrilus planipennis]